MKVSLILSYWNNISQIEADCCINKNKPELNCDGKCYIDAQLNKINTSTKEGLPGKVLQKEVELFFSTIDIVQLKKFSNSELFAEYFACNYKFNHYSEVFQPPTI